MNSQRAQHARRTAAAQRAEAGTAGVGGRRPAAALGRPRTTPTSTPWPARWSAPCARWTTSPGCCAGRSPATPRASRPGPHALRRHPRGRPGRAAAGRGRPARGVRQRHRHGRGAGRTGSGRRSGTSASRTWPGDRRATAMAADARRGGGLLDRPRDPLPAAHGGGRGGGDAVVRRAARPRAAVRVRAGAGLAAAGGGRRRRRRRVAGLARARPASGRGGSPAGSRSGCSPCRSRRTRSGTAWPRTCCCRPGGSW